MSDYDRLVEQARTLTPNGVKWTTKATVKLANDLARAVVHLQQQERITDRVRLDLDAQLSEARAERDAKQRTIDMQHGMLRSARASRDAARAEVDRLKASYGWLDERFPEVKAEVVRLTDGIREHREQVRHDWTSVDERLWSLLDVAGEGASDEAR